MISSNGWSIGQHMVGIVTTTGTAVHQGYPPGHYAIPPGSLRLSPLGLLPRDYSPEAIEEWLALD